MALDLLNSSNLEHLALKGLNNNICFICLHYSWNGVGCIISCCCIGLFVCLFVCFVIACHCKITAYVRDNKLILIFRPIFILKAATINKDCR